MRRNLFLALLLISILFACRPEKSTGRKDIEPVPNPPIIPVTKSDTLLSSEETPIIQPDTIISQEKLKAKEVAVEIAKNQPAKKVKEKAAEVKPMKVGKIYFDELVYEFGEINSGDIVNHRFLFTNNGQAPLNIKKAIATCGCTVPSYPFIAIEPGENGYIGVQYNSVGKEGEENPIITIETDGIPRTIQLEMKGTVVVNEN